MNRRSFLTGALAAPIAGVIPQAASVSLADRPDLDISPSGLDCWRIRSWEKEDGIWRPHLAFAERRDRKVRVDGRVAEAQRSEVDAWLRTFSVN